MSVDTNWPILILTHQIDPTADFVIHELTKRRTPFIRMDLGEFPVQMSLSARLDSDADDWTGAFIRPRRSVQMGAIRSVWWRRPTSFQFPETLSREERWFARDEAAAAFGGLLRLQDTFWLNHPEWNMRAEFKPLQLKTARRLGLRIPRTLITNSCDEARAFLRENEADGLRTIYKTLAYTDVINPVSAENEVVYTTVITENDLQDELVSVTPCLLQAEVPKDLELRVTVVRDQVFVAGIQSMDTAHGQLDFRMAYEEVKYVHADLPTELRDQLLQLTHCLNLDFGAIDVIRTPQGEYVFLEINPSGQWAWLESELGLPISAAICDALQEATPRAMT